jgi:hypothetical protein
MTRQERLSVALEAATEFMADFYPAANWWVVGGCLRDTELDRDFKDIDIFVAGSIKDALPDEDTDDGDRNAYLRRASTELITYQGEQFELNIIHMRGPDWDLKRVTDRCDFGVCMIGWCPKTGETYRSERYDTDMRWSTVTLYRETTSERRERMEKKFPTFRYRNPYRLKYDGAKVWCYNRETGKLDASVHKIKNAFA